MDFTFIFNRFSKTYNTVFHIHTQIKLVENLDVQYLLWGTCFDIVCIVGVAHDTAETRRI